MYSIYKTGDVITSDFSIKFPNDANTYEWGKSEIRSYYNYIRPIANLFENDRDNNYFIKNVFSGVTKDSSSNKILYGCEIKIDSTTKYKEVQPGAFINNGILYDIYPRCELCAKQIEKKLILQGCINVEVKINYADGKFSGYITSDGTTIAVNNKDCAIDFLNELNTVCATKFIDSTDKVTSYILLPFFAISSANIFYSRNDKIIKNGTFKENEDTSFSSPVIFKIDGDQLSPSSISNNILKNNTIQIGSTVVSLGGYSNTITGLSSLNELSFTKNGDDTGFTISGGGKSLIVPASYTLGNACERNITTVVNAASADKLTTASAIINYLTESSQTYSGDSEFTGKLYAIGSADIGGSITPVNFDTSGVLEVKNTTAATMKIDNITYSGSTVTSTISNVSASEIVDGGLAVKQNIISGGDILGQNVSSRSSRALKENIKPFTDNAIEIVNGVSIVSYNMKADLDKNFKVGFIADDTTEILSTVNHDKMDINNCVGILLKAVQELSAEVQNLKEEINDLKSSARI